jgi:TolB-like protein
MGDGLLAEFPSAVEAARCAVEIQHMIGDRNAEVPEENRIAYRIGINIGDIVVEDNDIYGDGVNIAARLEGLAEPNGICVARNVFDQVKDKLDLTIEHLGEHEVKNIAEPVTIYRVVLDDKAAALVTPVVQGATKPTGRRWVAAAATAVVLVTAVGAVIWWRPWAPVVEPASLERMALPLPEQPSIAVLPFDNLSDNPSQEYFADGMAEDLITDLSKIPTLLVIARNSSFAYKDKRTDVRTIARELGVKYVLEGSVRRAGDQVRINAQLIDATTGGHLWAERYNRDYKDIFALQDEITRKIAASLAIELTESEEGRVTQRETDNPLAYDAFLQGWAYFVRNSRDDLRDARPFFEKAVELDPNYGRAYAALARVYELAWNRGWYVDLGWGDARCQTEKYLHLAMKRPTSLAHMVAAGKRLTEQRYDEAVDEIERAITFDPSDARVLTIMSWIMTIVGKSDAGLKVAEKSMRLDPSNLARNKWVVGLAHFGMDELDKAAASFETARELNPHLSAFPQAATLSRLGYRDQAEVIILEYMKLRGWSEASTSTQAFKENKHQPWGSVDTYLNYFPYRRPEDVERFAGALVDLGMCCQSELQAYIERLQEEGHARSAATQRHLDSLSEGKLEACVSGE